MKTFENSGHLFRLAAVFVAAFALFLIIRSVLVPKSFGEYGHYRGNAIVELAARPVAYAGHQTCETCHADVPEIKNKGKHARLSCEVCHGPLAKHAEDPAAVVPVLPDTAVICARCHEKNIAKPDGFPQVVSQEHSGGMACNTCHKPHSPVIGAGGGK